MDKLNSLIARYRGEAHEDEMVGFYPLCAFGENRVAASIDTPLHAFLPFDHVDHLHPDWAIALAASANGERKMQEFNTQVRPEDHLGAVAAARVRARADAEARGRRHARLRRPDSRRPRALHVGRHAERVLPEQHSHDRRDGRVHPGARRPQGRAARSAAPRSPRRSRIVNRSSRRSCRTCAASSRRTGASSRTSTVRTMR